MLKLLSKLTGGSSCCHLSSRCTAEVYFILFLQHIAESSSKQLTPDYRLSFNQEEPEISIKGSEATFTLLMVDPDAPSPHDPKFRNWLHWMVINIPGALAMMVVFQRSHNVAIKLRIVQSVGAQASTRSAATSSWTTWGRWAPLHWRCSFLPVNCMRLSDLRHGPGPKNALACRARPRADTATCSSCTSRAGAWRHTRRMRGRALLCGTLRACTAWASPRLRRTSGQSQNRKNVR